MKIKRLGSNQYKKVRYVNHWFLRLAVLFLAVMALVYVLSQWYEREMAKPFVSPLPEGGLQVKEVKAAERTPVTEMEVVKMIVQEFEYFGPKVVKEALDIAYCESRFDPEAVHANTNGTIDRGVFQISSIHGYSKYKLTAAWENINIAKQMYKKSGWRPWVCRRVLQ